MALELLPTFYGSFLQLLLATDDLESISGGSSFIFVRIKSGMANAFTRGKV